MTTRWEECSSPQLAAIDMAHKVAVIPFGAIEQHGPHLPLGTDVFLIEAVLASACSQHMLRLPTQYIGTSPEHCDFTGTISLSSETALAAWRSIIESILHAGVQRFLLLNGHGGQIGLLDILAFELRARYHITIAQACWWRLARLDDLMPADERRYGLHGGMLETAAMLAARPDLVQNKEVKTFLSRAMIWDKKHPLLSPRGAGSLAWRAGDLHPDGCVGDAAAATQELGRIILERATRGLEALVADLADFDLHG